MKKILLIFKKDLKRRAKSPYAVLILLLIPIIMTALLGWVFSPSGEENKLPKIKVLVVDKDNSIASQFLIQALKNPQMKDMFQVSLVSEKEGKKSIAKGKASALLIIPEDFLDNILQNKKSQFTLIKNPAERFLPVIVEEFMNTLAVIVSGFTQVFAEEINGIRMLTEIHIKDMPVSLITPYLEKSKQKIISLQQYVDPLLIKLKEEVKEKEKKEAATKQPVINIFAQVLPGISIMFLFFIIEIFLRDILTEREKGTLQRIMFSSIRPAEYILAKIFSGWLMGIIVYLIVVAVGILIFNISWGNYLYLFVFIGVTCSWIAGFFALLNSFFKNRNQAGAITAPIIIIFSAFGGSMIQVSQLPGTFQTVSRATLNYWFIEGVGQISKGDFPGLSFMLIFSTAAILFFLSFQLLKRKFRV